MANLLILAKTPSNDCETSEIVHRGALLQMEEETKKYGQVVRRLDYRSTNSATKKTLLESIGKCEFQVLFAQLDGIWSLHISSFIWAYCPSVNNGSDVVHILLANKEKLSLRPEFTVDQLYSMVSKSRVIVRQTKEGNKCCLIKTTGLGHREDVPGMIILVYEDRFLV